MNRTLAILQKLYQIGKILCKIAFICSIVGGCLCAAGIFCLALGLETLKLGGVTFQSLISTQAEMSVGTLYASMAALLIVLSGEAVLAKFAEHYFRRELADGTPFVEESAKELFRLGILTICIPLGSLIVAEIFQAVLAHEFADIVPLHLDGASSVALGAMFLVASLLCRYGAQLSAGQKEGERER